MAAWATDVSPGPRSKTTVECESPMTGADSLTSKVTVTVPALAVGELTRTRPT